MLDELFAKKVITLNEKKKIGTFPLEKQKMVCLLDDIILPSLNNNVIEKFEGLLEVMEKSDDSVLTDMAKRLGM